MATASKTRALSGPPGTLGLYARAALPMIPGASRLPFVAGRGRAVPKTRLTLEGVHADASQLAAYDRVCGFPLRDALPSTYVHVLAFPLHMALMTDGSFPFGAVGLVHVRNRITQHRAIRAGETFDLTVFTMPTQPHPKGITFTIVSEARVDGELVWQDASTMLKRGAKAPNAGHARSANADRAGGVRRDDPASLLVGAPDASTGPARSSARTLPFQAEWRLPADLGRRYAAASGDVNPIHMHALSAKLLGFPRAIAHGMWTKARCLAAMESRLPDAYTVDVSFRRPILLPSKVAFAAQDGHFVVRATRDETKIHLEGTVTAA